ncbi:hypothetical protein PV516_40660 [Streptomyces scabiei]|uniref:hypothetical protein n=1 Tax=Streptomyces scabiei TaxID=1930 RepID=UPI0029A8971D|nr:hypothetical protein [Streptomyces scabiei]MDX3170076.1 hypothetical protein [Streptomyces scabiei]
MTTDASVQIVDVLLGLAAGVAVIAALAMLQRHRYQGPPPEEPYAGFQAGARDAGTGEFVQLECEGYCPGRTAHEITGDGGATCVLCGTHRALPDVVDDHL